MAKSDAQDGIGCLVISGVIIAVIWVWLDGIAQSVGGWDALFMIAVVFAICLAVFIRKLNQLNIDHRRQELLEKYKDDMLVMRIMRKEFWQGQTREQLLDSLGIPAGQDHSVSKSKREEVWKYRPQGGNRYGLRITLENDVVTGWFEKG